MCHGPMRLLRACCSGPRGMQQRLFLRVILTLQPRGPYTRGGRIRTTMLSRMPIPARGLTKGQALYGHLQVHEIQHMKSCRSCIRYPCNALPAA